MLQVAVTRQNFFEIVTRVGHAMLKRVHLVFDLLESSERGQSRLMHCGARLEMNMLREQAELQSACADNITAIRSLFTSDQTEDCGLARAVPADQAHMFAGINLQAGATQHVLRAVRFMNV